MSQKNQIFAIEVKPGEEPKKIHTFAITLEFTEAISFSDAYRLLHYRLAEMCDKEFEVETIIKFKGIGRDLG